VVEFGRVRGIVEALRNPATSQLVLTVTLETEHAVNVVRSQVLDPVRPARTQADLAWHADQWTQETIGVDLAEQGWEVLGVSETDLDLSIGPPRSATYSVRRLFKPPPSSPDTGTSGR
jgi:hypothetical protein